MKAICLGVFLCAVGASLAYPVLEDQNGNLVELIPLRRFPRRAVMEPRSEHRPIMVMPRGEEPIAYDEPMQAGSAREPITAETGHGHGHGYDYVDYGAYTGGYGAFGWYTDHPVYSYGH